MERRMLILTSIVLCLLCTLTIGIQTAKADEIYDLNDDGIVDIKDIVHVAAAFGSRLGDPDWDSIADVDGSGRVDIKDVGLVARQFGQMRGSVFVIPEYPIGPILGIVGCFAALGVSRLMKTGKHNWHFQ